MTAQAGWTLLDAASVTTTYCSLTRAEPTARHGGEIDVTHRQLPAECAPVLRALVRPLHDQMEEQGLSQARLGIQLGCDRSRVSRALSGREVPPLHLVEQIAEALGADVDQARRRWIHADAIRRKTRACEAGGGPPDGLYTYTDLLRALRDLMRGRGVTQRELTRRDHRLRRSTVGAVLRGERAARPGMVIAIVRACGVNDAPEQAWATAWWRLGQPHQEERRRRRWQGYQYMIKRDATWM